MSAASGYGTERPSKISFLLLRFFDAAAAAVGTSWSMSLVVVRMVVGPITASANGLIVQITPFTSSTLCYLSRCI